MVEAAVLAVSDEILDSERLTDPCNDRVVQSVKPIPAVPLSLDRVFTSGAYNSGTNTGLVKNYMYEGGRISKECVLEIIRRVKAIFTAEPNLLRTNGNLVMVGDIHGQFYDLLAMLKRLEERADPNQKIIFLGDYVYRGKYGPHVALYLFCLKIKDPNRILLLRGNHESRDMVTQYNFR